MEAKAGPVRLTCDGSGRLDRSAFGEMLYSMTQGKAPGFARRRHVVSFCEVVEHKRLFVLSQMF